MTNWYFQLMGDTIGPLSGAELRERAINGQITADTLISRDGTDKWIFADRVNGLLDIVPESTAKPSERPPITTVPAQPREHSAMPTPVKTTKEYKVLTQKDKWFSGKFDPAKLEEALNAYAEQGWVVKAATTAAITGLIGGNRDEMIVILER